VRHQPARQAAKAVNASTKALRIGADAFYVVTPLPVGSPGFIIGA
jgi:hypothetical protein